MGYFGKRFLDIVASLFLLVFLSPFLLLIALLVFIFDGRPIIFKQERIGLNGNPFIIFKFRSMVDEKVKNRKPENRNGRDDLDRVTMLGRFLRKTSIDELLQLINILKGEMSFIGPRPIQYWMKDKMSDEERRIYLCRPGMTGLPQVIDRSLGSLSKKRRRYNEFYYQKCSLQLDVWILLKTFKVLFDFKKAN